MPGSRRGRRHSGRLAAMLVVMLAALAAVAVRVVWIQVVRAPVYAALAGEQRLRDIALSPRRGAIYDREGQPLAISSEARTVYANPHFVQDATATASTLASVLGGDAATYAAKLRKDAGFVYLARKIDMDRARELESMELAGVGFLEDSRRTYPSGALACQVLGFVGVDDEGLSGIESHYDGLLAGERGRLLAERDPAGRLIPGGVQVAEDPVDGHDIVLTIDKDIQHLAEVELAAAVGKWQAKSGSVVVMDARTGEVYAMASAPSFDPNAFSKADPRAFRNRPVTDVYEPGSTIKTFTAAAVIQEGIYTTESKLGLPPTIKVGGRTIKEAHPRGAVTWSVAEIVTNSSNVGSVMLGQALGKERIYDYFDRFGLTSRTGIDFPGEACGFLPPPKQWSASSIGNIPFGQGVSVTPLQLTRALGAVANAGELVTPHLLLDVPDEPGKVPTWPRADAVEASACAVMNTVLKAVITDGTGKNAAVAGYSVAGKTGTAQKPRTDGRGYKGGGYVASFSGYLPADDPRLVIVVTVDDPRGAIYGGVVAAPVFSRVAAFSAAHLKVPPVSAAATPTAGAPTTGTTPGGGP